MIDKMKKGRVARVKAKLYRLFFLMNDQGQSVEVVETQDINVEEIVQRLNHGESVYITINTNS